MRCWGLWESVPCVSDAGELAQGFTCPGLSHRVGPLPAGLLHAGLRLSPKASPQGLLPVSWQGIFIFFLVKYKPLKYNNIYTYPTWGYSIGWLMALSSMLCIPLWIFIKMWKTEGTLPEVRQPRWGRGWQVGKDGSEGAAAHTGPGSASWAEEQEQVHGSYLNNVSRMSPHTSPREAMASSSLEGVHYYHCVKSSL